MSAPTFELVMHTGDPARPERVLDNFARTVFGGAPVAPPASARLGIRCLACGAVSWHPRDVAERYCGRCHRFHEDAAAGPP